MKQHTHPCAQCPFRRDSLRGYLGASTTLEFLSMAEHEPRVPCHIHVDYEDEDWEDKLHLVPRCAGHAIYLRNRGKCPHDRGLADMVRSVAPDRDNVFGMHLEFLRYHGGDESRLANVLMGIDNGSDK